jgi:formate hydrogenlyase subunit 3/multisubunit Na+/H+ antiporter MnhD subunit
MNLLAVFILTSLSALLVAAFVRGRHRGRAALAASLWMAVFSSVLSIVALTGNEIGFVLATSYIWGNVPFAIDPLSAWFILVINLTVVPGVWYAPAYLKDHGPAAGTGLHFVMLTLVHLSLILVCTVQSALAFLFVWEMMSLSSFLLVIFDSRRRSVLRAGLNYLVQMHVSVVFLMTAFLLVYRSAGGFEFARIGEYFSSHPSFLLFLLFFIGFGIKAGAVPFHTWLPHAHPAAPSHVSGIMSGVIVKMGIYGILRMASFLQSDLLLIGNTVLITGMATGIYGVLHASVQRDVKRLLAYCTVENVGLILMGTGLGMIGQHFDSAFLVLAGYGGALLHVLNHALCKSLLFFGAGAVYRAAHTRDMNRLGGLWKMMPRTAALFLAGSLAAAGLPPLNGFLSEFVLFSGFIKGVMLPDMSERIVLILGVTTVALVGGVSMLTFTCVFGSVFTGRARTLLPESVVETPRGMLLPQYVVAGAMVLVALLPAVFFGVASRVAASAFGLWELHPAISGFIGLLQKVGLVTVLFVLSVVIVYTLRKMIALRLPESADETWGCGSVYQSPRMQYTASSFTRPAAKLFGSLLPIRRNCRQAPPDGIFPGAARCAYKYGDWVETKVIHPAARLAKRVGKAGLHIQDGRLQWYILYGLLFILVIILLTWFGLM